MDLDFHYGTMYVLSRWAGFGSQSAQLIATSSQLVDDNYDTNAFSDKAEEEDIARGVNVRYSCQNIWANVSGYGNEEIWIPFHFLPGLEGESEAERLVCKKHSVLAEELKRRMNGITLDNPNYVFRLGIAGHVLADTWAHQEFAGINDAINQVQELLFSRQGSMLKKMIGEVFDSSLAAKVMDLVMPLGHAAAVHCPDIPYLWWRTSRRFFNGRKNWDEFLEAASELCEVLQKVSGVEVTGLSREQRIKLMTCFKTIQSRDIGDRYAAWVDRIQHNYFEFGDFDDGDKHAAYSSGTIFADPDWRRQFYEEINDHYFWVKGKLIDNGIDRLDKKGFKGY